MPVSRSFMHAWPPHSVLTLTFRKCQDICLDNVIFVQTPAGHFVWTISHFTRHLHILIRLANFNKSIMNNQYIVMLVHLCKKHNNSRNRINCQNCPKRKSVKLTLSMHSSLYNFERLQSWLDPFLPVIEGECFISIFLWIDSHRSYSWVALGDLLVDSSYLFLHP